MFRFEHKVDGCGHCARLEKARRGELGALIWEREHSIAVVGDHQFFAGYSMLISKHHIREMHDLPSEIGNAMFMDLMELGRSIDKAFKPWKINYASLGNVDEHLHWHVFPRYEADPDKRDQPWKNSAQFAKFSTSEREISLIKNRLCQKF